jgi:hypothetical protein
MRSTQPAVILEEDLINHNLDKRELEDGEDIKEFEMDVVKKQGVVRAALCVVAEHKVNGLLVALPRKNSMMPHQHFDMISGEIEALIVGYVTVNKIMFPTRERSACDQITLIEGCLRRKWPLSKLFRSELLDVYNDGYLASCNSNIRRQKVARRRGLISATLITWTSVCFVHCPTAKLTQL